ncbi:MAG: AGE family epimerase/isomerase [Anaerolineaceae bacterium]|nr:AGE family epimerase/isomerase [Anaerolineaceae bacterium]
MQKIADAARKMLLSNIIPFWLNLKDEENGGYIGYVGYDLVPDKQAEKGCILNSRILWFFSKCGIYLRKNELKAAAEHAYIFLRDHFVDRTNGGVYWSVDCRGQKLDAAKQTYNQAFAIYGLSTYYCMSGNREALDLAFDLFTQIETRCFDGKGYLESFQENWTTKESEQLNENGVNAARKMNTLLHIFEAYTELYYASKNEKVAAAMYRVLNIYKDRFFDPARRSLKVFCDTDYNSLLDIYSYGYDIEASWLMDRGCALLSDQQAISKIYEIDAVLADNAYENGFLGECMATERVNGNLDPWRVWWVQSEAVLGFVNQWEQYPKKGIYADVVKRIFHCIQRDFVDHRPGGEWFWRVDENGNPDREKPVVEPWKCPYHNSRMCLELIRRDPDIYI